MRREAMATTYTTTSTTHEYWNKLDWEAREQQLLAEIDDLRNGVAAGKRAADTCKDLTRALRDIEEVLDRRCPDAYPGKIGIPCRVEALIDAWGDALTALDDLLKNPNSTEARERANAALVAGGFER